MLVISLLTRGSPEQLSGGYLFHRRMADAAAAHDARIEFISAKPLIQSLAAPGADVVLVDSIAAWRVAPRALASRAAAPRALASVRTPRGPSRRALARWFGRAPSTPLAAILHQPPGGIDHGGWRRRAQALLDRSLYRRCARLLVASQALADELVAHHGLPRSQLVVVPPGCDVAPPPAEGPDLRDGRRAAFVSVGNWVARKGTLELLDAFAALPPDLATLHLAGRDDAEAGYGARVRSRLARPDLRDRVVVHGPIRREEVARLYAGADAFVLPSYVEPYGTVYGEALAAGLPVVGWRAGNLPHLATSGREGVILEPGDVAGLTEALRRLAGDEPWRRQLAEAARTRGARLPTWDDTAAAFFAALRSLVPPPGGG